MEGFGYGNEPLVSGFIGEMYIMTKIQYDCARNGGAMLDVHRSEMGGNVHCCKKKKQKKHKESVQVAKIIIIRV